MPIPSVNSLTRSRRTTQAQFQSLVTDWIAAIAGQAGYTAGEKAYLIRTGGASITAVDAILWIHASLIRNLGYQDRLAWSGYDPLGIAALSEYIVFVDAADTLAVTLPGAGSSNNVTLPAGLGGGTRDLWAANTTSYNTDCRRWKKPRSESGSQFRRDYPRVAVTPIVLFRGPSQTLDEEIDIQRNDGTNPQVTELWWLPYPGEGADEKGVDIRCGNSAYTSGDHTGEYRNEVMIDTYRKFRTRHLDYVGNREEDGELIFAVAGIFGFYDHASLNSTANGFEMKWCGYGCTRGISPDHLLAATLPHLVDREHDNRFPVLTEGYQIYDLTVSCESGGTIEENVFEFAPDEFPYVPSELEDDDGYGSQGHGDGIRVVGFPASSQPTTGVIIRNNKFNGLVPHLTISLYNCDDCTVTGNQIENAAHSPIGVNNLESGGGYGIGNHTITYNRVGLYGTLFPRSCSGIQLSGSSGCEIYGNVVYGNDDSVSVPTRGIHVAMFPGQDNDADDNDVHHNILWRTGLFLGNDGAYAASNAEVMGNDLHHNAIYSRADLDPDVEAGGALLANALIRLNIAEAVANSGRGNTITDNLMQLGDAAYYTTIQTSGSFTTHTLDAIGTWYVRNTAHALIDSFRDPNNGDFRWDDDATLDTLFADHVDSMLLVPMGSDRSILNPLVALSGPVARDFGELRNDSPVATLSVN